MRLVALAALVALVPATRAWGFAGHEIVATIAEVLLYPSALAAIRDHHLLPSLPNSPRDGHLATLAAWADRVRMGPYAWSSRLHYANAVGDWPPDKCTLEGGWKEQDNVLTAVRNYTERLVSGEGEPRNVSLAFVIHFHGDLHQPLHLTGRNRGGNGDQVFFEHRHTNMHSVWDSGIIAKHIREQSNYTSPLPSKRIEAALTGAIYDPYIRLILWEGLRAWWRTDIDSWLQCPSSSSSSPSSGTGSGSGSGSGSGESIYSFLDPLPSHPDQILFQAQPHGPPGGLANPTDTAPPAVLGVVCPELWAEQVHPLDCGTVYPKGFDDAAELPKLEGGKGLDGLREEVDKIMQWAEELVNTQGSDGGRKSDSGRMKEGNGDPLWQDGAKAEIEEWNRVFDLSSTLSQSDSDVTSVEDDSASSSRLLRRQRRRLPSRRPSYPTQPQPPSHLPDLSTPAYLDPLKRDHTVERLLAMAGVRLAATLNKAFGKEDEMGAKGVEAGGRMLVDWSGLGI